MKTATTLPAMTRLRLTVGTDGAPEGRIAIRVASHTVATVKNGGDMIRNIDRALKVNGFVRTLAFRPSIDSTLISEAVKVA